MKNCEKFNFIRCDIVNELCIGIYKSTLFFYEFLGKLPFRSGLNLVWDGKTKHGNDAVSGVYNYLIEVVDNSGVEHTFTGFVHLFK